MDICEECDDVPAELCARCGRVVCSRCGYCGKHVTEAVRQLPPTGPACSSDEPSHSIDMCLGLEAQDIIAAGSGSGGSTMVTGEALTFTAKGRHDYTMQMQAEGKSHGLFAE